MDKTGTKPIIGILGGVCSGKSTVANEFVKLGCGLIDADKISHEFLDKSGVKSKIIKLFGEAVLGSSGQIDHKKLADIVFSDADRLSSLNEILHPLVLERAEELISQYNRQNQVKAIVLDMPLLVEVGWAERCDKLIFVDCNWKLRVDRARKVGFFDENQLKNRENFQIPLDSKVSLVDNTLDNNSDFSALAKQVADIFSYIVDNC